MTTFLDGPAVNECLLLHLAPLFLRVTCDDRRMFDALDQPGDTPQPGETVTAYRRIGEVGRPIHLNMTGPRGQRVRGFYRQATYAVCPEQPPAAVMADAGAWQAWCNGTTVETMAQPEST